MGGESLAQRPGRRCLNELIEWRSVFKQLHLRSELQAEQGLYWLSSRNPMRRIILVGTVGLVCAQLSAQVRPYVMRGDLPAGNSPPASFRQVIERHFESAHPVARVQLRGAIPGSQLISVHNASEAALPHRMEITGVTSPLATPRAPPCPVWRCDRPCLRVPIQRQP